MGTTTIARSFLESQRLVLISDSILQSLEYHFKFVLAGVDLGEHISPGGKIFLANPLGKEYNFMLLLERSFAIMIISG